MTKSMIFQSGQKVPTSGPYEVVGASPTTVTAQGETAPRDLTAGETFPAFQGWEVCWRPVGGDSDRALDMPLIHRHRVTPRHISADSQHRGRFQ
jgi:hypothetical protein